MRALKAIHLNDAKMGLGSRLDRHAPVGKGHLGRETFRRIVGDERVAGIPLILETPGGLEGWKRGAPPPPPPRPEERVMDPQALASRAKSLALEVGFDLAGVASPQAPRELAFFAEWIARGYAGEMAYLTSQIERRSDLRAAFPWARSVVSVALQYDTPASLLERSAARGRGWIARYAWGDDYHEVMRAMLERLVERLAAEAGPFRSRVYADTGPIAERAYAAAAGIGAWGKNTCLLHPEQGSWFFLGEAVTDLEMAAGRAPARHVRQLHRVPRRLPDGGAPRALRPGRDALHQLPDHRAARRDPRRRSAREWGATSSAATSARTSAPGTASAGAKAPPASSRAPGARRPTSRSWRAWTRRRSARRFRRSALKRAKRRGLLRNVAVALGNAGDASHVPVLERMAEDPDPLIREHALWALGKLTHRSPDPVS